VADLPPQPRDFVERILRESPFTAPRPEGVKTWSVYIQGSDGHTYYLTHLGSRSASGFDTSRSGAEAEARTVVQQFETAQFLPIAVRARLSGDLVCYARTVIHQEWPRMESGTIGGSRNPWSLAMLRTLRTTEPRLASEQTA
jgi:hypothetical protein